MKVTVWYDDTSMEKGFIVDSVDKDGNSKTVEAFDDLISAVRFGVDFAKKNNLLLRTTPKAGEQVNGRR
jgi:hypothetical protein